MMQPETRILLLLCASSAALVVLAVAWLYLWWEQKKFSRRVAEILLAAGLEKTGQDRYRASFNGRDFDVYFFPAHNSGRARIGPTLELRLRGVFNAQLVVALPKFLAQSKLSAWLQPTIRETPWEINPAGFGGYLVFTAERVSAAQFLEMPPARQAILALLDNFGLQQVALSIFPNILRFQVRQFDPEALTPDLIRRWLKDLDQIASLAGQLPPISSETLEKARQLVRQRARPRVFQYWMLGLTFFLFISILFYLLRR